MAERLCAIIGKEGACQGKGKNNWFSLIRAFSTFSSFLFFSSSAVRKSAWRGKLKNYYYYAAGMLMMTVSTRARGRRVNKFLFE